MTFVNLPEQYINAKWHFHPVEFVQTMRRCGWLSTEEFVQCLPRKSLSDANLSWSNAFARAKEHGKYINHFLRKYLGASRNRHVHSLSQIYAETGLLSLQKEKGAGRMARYGPFYGRGYMQLTWPVNYDNYGKFKNIANQVRPQYVDPRIDAKFLFYFDEARKSVVWYPRYDPELIISDLVHSADSCGLFWIEKHFRGTKNINRACDLKLTPTTVGFICWLINAGNNGYLERQQFSKYLENIFLDNPPREMHVSFDYPPLDRAGNPPRDPELCRTFPPTEIAYSLKGQVDHARQTR